MDCRNQRGQILVESLFLVFIVISILIGFQMMIDNQQKEFQTKKLSKTKKDLYYVKKIESITAE